MKMGDSVGYFRIVFTDDDSIPVNTRVHYKLYGDELDLLHPDCNMFENEHNGDLKQTVFGCKLIFARSGILRKTPYCVTLRAVDQTVEVSPYRPTETESFANASVCLTTNLNRIHEYDMPRPEALTGSVITYASPSSSASSSSSFAEGSGYRAEPKQTGRRGRKSKKEANTPKIVYPKEVIVYNTSRKYARIAEPESFLQLVQENSADLNFRLTSNPLNAFGITKIAGIIYLKNETAFQNKPESRHEITVAWKNSTVSILVRLRMNPDVVHCAPVPVDDDGAAITEDFCAAHSNRSSCEGACGLGSLRGPCEYRPKTDMFMMWTEQYPTCSSGLSHCPDGVCDPLEEMGHREKIHICPQDCVFKQDILGLHHSDKPRGIHTASGHCSCRASGHCSCIETLRVPSSSKRNRTTTSSSTSTTTTTTTPSSIVAGVSGSEVEVFPIGGKNGSEGKLPESEGTRRDPNDRSQDAPPAAVRDGSFYEPGLIKGPHASLYLIAIVLIPMVVAVMIVLYCFSRKLSVKNKLLNGSGTNGTGGGMNSISMNLVSNDTEIFNVELPLTTRINEINFKIDVKTDCAKIAIFKEEQDRLESLWTPPQYETVDSTSVELTGRYQTPSAMAVAAVISELSEDKKQLLLQSYDTPRPLIETATIEQKLRYENDVRLRPKKLSNASGSSSPGSNDDQQHRTCINAVRSSSISPPRCLRNHFEETSFITRNSNKTDRGGDTASCSSSSSGSGGGAGGCCNSNGEYDSPSRQPRRVVSYVDMNKNNRHLNANLEINHMIDKKQSKDIALRFSNVDNELQMVLVDPISQGPYQQNIPTELDVTIVNDAVLAVQQQRQQNADNKNGAATGGVVEYTEVVKKPITAGKGTEPIGLTLTSTV
uniref:RET cysteine rich domain-containing protein n=1 Tax=Anopheles epiroticus TaxID=199890 RepID=A0A182P8A1_9DIPT